LTTLSFATFATEVGGTYVTAGAWNVEADFGNGLEASGVTIDNEDTVGTFTVGYQFDDHLSVEAGVIGTGDVSVSYTGSGSGTYLGKVYSYTVAGSVKAETDTSYTLSLHYSESIYDKLDVYVKGGLLFWDVEYSVTGSNTFTYDGIAYSIGGKFAEADGSDGYYGVGASYAIAPNISVNAEYMESEINDSDINGLSLAVAFDF
jgi:opacity protein-like surface antigen